MFILEMENDIMKIDVLFFVYKDSGINTIICIWADGRFGLNCLHSGGRREFTAQLRIRGAAHAVKQSGAIWLTRSRSWWPW